MIIIRNRLLCFITAIVLVMSFASGPRAQPAAFVSVIPDLPLMEGLLEDVEQTVLFETDSGRIAEVVARGQIARRAVTEFYAATLPQLGWRLLSNVQYQREGEVLNLVIQPDGRDKQHLVVQFKLSPAVQ
jgi:hypothetical protein